jgi:hypothetical protein
MYIPIVTMLSQVETTYDTGQCRDRPSGLSILIPVNLKVDTPNQKNYFSKTSKKIIF